MRLEMTCTSLRIRCMPARLSRTAPSPRVAASSVWPAAFAAEAALEATSCTERDIVSTSRLDRKSTRLNSSHSQISYPVFCLKERNLLERIAGLDRIGRPIAVAGPLVFLALPSPLFITGHTFLIYRGFIFR